MSQSLIPVVQTGVATQCLKSIKCRNAKLQYFANVLLKFVLITFYHLNSALTSPLRVNVKLGGVNTVPDPNSVIILADSTNQTCVMGRHTSFHRQQSH